MNDDSLITLVEAEVFSNSILIGWNHLIDVFREELELNEVTDIFKLARFDYDT